jgi:hypothetical protein
MEDWLEAIWNGKPRVSSRKQGMLVLEAFKDHLSLEVRSVIHAMNTDLVVIP